MNWTLLPTAMMLQYIIMKQNSSAKEDPKGSLCSNGLLFLLLLQIMAAQCRGVAKLLTVTEIYPLGKQ